MLVNTHEYVTQSYLLGMQWKHTHESLLVAISHAYTEMRRIYNPVALLPVKRAFHSVQKAINSVA
jgi:hypothetical protein